MGESGPSVLPFARGMILKLLIIVFVHPLDCMSGHLCAAREFARDARRRK